MSERLTQGVVVVPKRPGLLVVLVPVDVRLEVIPDDLQVLGEEELGVPCFAFRRRWVDELETGRERRERRQSEEDDDSSSGESEEEVEQEPSLVGCKMMHRFGRKDAKTYWEGDITQDLPDTDEYYTDTGCKSYSGRKCFSRQSTVEAS